MKLLFTAPILMAVLSTGAMASPPDGARQDALSVTVGTGDAPIIEARRGRGADDPAGHIRRGRGKDDGAGKAENPGLILEARRGRGRGADDGAGHA